jgi:nicotinamide-nucleotide amidase
MGRPPAPQAVVLSVGSELLAGETVDTNAAFLGGRLRDLGVDLTEVRQLPDDRAVLAAAFRQAGGAADIVLVTGGLGPTHDDLTREGLADALGEKLAADPVLEDELRERFGRLGSMPATNLRQAMRIPSADALPNPIGSAPGWWLDRGTEAVIALMPGVPSEMRRMFDEQVAPRLAGRLGPVPLHVRTLKTFGIGESAVAELLGPLLEEPGDGVISGIYARDDGVHLRFTTREDPAAVDAAAARVRQVMGDRLWGEDGDDLAFVALTRFAAAGCATVASWEADTGGALLAALSAATPTGPAASYVGGVLDSGGAPAAPAADACVQLSLLPEDSRGRSRVRVAVSGRVAVPREELRIHGSGPQRLRRAAFAALDHVRRSLPPG